MALSFHGASKTPHKTDAFPVDRLSRRTDPERKALTAIINTWVGMAPVHYASVRAQVNAHFGIASVDHLTVAQVKEAIQWVQAKIDALPPAPEQLALPTPAKDKFEAYLEEVEAFRVRTQQERERLFHTALDLVDVYKTGRALSRALFSVISDWLDKTALSPTSIFDSCLTPYAPILIARELERKLPSMLDFLPGKKR